MTIGVVVASLSRPSSGTAKNTDDERYFVGILMLTTSLLLTGVLGVLQEQTYKKYGPCWREGVFYTVSTYEQDRKKGSPLIGLGCAASSVVANVRVSDEGY